jgi:hypothetical protein
LQRHNHSLVLGPLLEPSNRSLELVLRNRRTELELEHKLEQEHKQVLGLHKQVLELGSRMVLELEHSTKERRRTC